MAGAAGATPVDVDHIVYPGLTATNPGVYAGSVDMSYADGVLTIVLRNTSTGLAGPEAADNLLTGIGFDLPDGVWIAGGSVVMAPGWDAGDLFNVTPPIGWNGNLSSEWGYDTQGINSGAFGNADLMDGNFVDNAVSVMESQTTGRLAGGSLGGSPGLGGTDFGLLSDAVDGGILGNGLAGIQHAVVISLGLGGDIPADLVARINRGDVVLSFGSPTGVPVPEPSTLALLLFGGLFGLAKLRRRSK
ncbi:MAG TPA: hypothetical protein DCM87_20215 [Planctomycetes bacterium]|nr:hypothetical protein [Planctomycetota bacterium]